MPNAPDWLIQVLERFEGVNVLIFVPSGYSQNHRIFNDLQALSEEKYININYLEIIDRKVRTKK